jgi:hypothetical protein
VPASTVGEELGGRVQDGEKKRKLDKELDNTLVGVVLVSPVDTDNEEAARTGTADWGRVGPVVAPCGVGVLSGVWRTERKRWRGGGAMEGFGFGTGLAGVGGPPGVAGVETGGEEGEPAFVHASTSAMAAENTHASRRYMLV